METVEKSYLQECLLVGGQIKTEGCLSYDRQDRKAESNGVGELAEWKTLRTVINIDEQANLYKVRGVLEKKITDLGWRLSGLGWIIPLNNESALDLALAEIRQAVKDYNRSATCTSIRDILVAFRIASTDEKVADALYTSAVDLLSRAATAIEKGDVKELREALNGLVGIDKVLPPEQGSKISSLIEGARKQARIAVKGVKAAALGDEEKEKGLMGSLLSSLKDGVSGIRASLVEVASEIEQSLPQVPTAVRVVELVLTDDSEGVSNAL